MQEVQQPFILMGLLIVNLSQNGYGVYAAHSLMPNGFVATSDMVWDPQLTVTDAYGETMLYLGEITATKRKQLIEGMGLSVIG